MKKHLILILLGLLSINSFSISELHAEQKQARVLDKAVAEAKAANKYPGMDWTLNNLQGQPIRLSDYQGKPVLLVFWASWCPYCKKLFPGVNRVYQKYKEQGFTVIAMNIREDGDPAGYMKERGYDFEVALESDLIAAQYGVKGTPTLVFIAKSGEILGQVSISDPEHPVLEHFAKEQLGLAESGQTP